MVHRANTMSHTITTEFVCQYINSKKIHMIKIETTIIMDAIYSELISRKYYEMLIFR